MLRDPDLLEFIENLDCEPWSGYVYRTIWAERDPTHGNSGKSGRWSSPYGQFEILNTSKELSGAESEFESFWSLFEQRPDKPVLTHKLKINVKKLIHLDFSTLEKLGIDKVKYEQRDYFKTQEIADAINFLGYDALVSPSARFPCENLTIFFQNLPSNYELEKIESYNFHWSE